MPSCSPFIMCLAARTLLLLRTNSFGLLCEPPVHSLQTLLNYLQLLSSLPCCSSNSPCNTKSTTYKGRVYFSAPSHQAAAGFNCVLLTNPLLFPTCCSAASSPRRTRTAGHRSSLFFFLESPLSLTYSSPHLLHRRVSCRAPPDTRAPALGDSPSATSRNQQHLNLVL
jgi:hypothetical protein